MVIPPGRSREARATDDRGGGQRSEIPAVEGVGGPVHEEDFALGEDAAALPDGQRAATAVALAGVAHGNGVDADGAAETADGLTGERQNVLQHRHAARQVAAFGKERRERLPAVSRRPDH